jgi:hypothetical protein
MDDKLRELREVVRKWPNSKAKDEIRKLEAKRRTLDNERQRYLFHLGGGHKMTKSKVKEIKTVKEFNGDRGSTWYFTVEMENGDKGQIARKSEAGLKVGQEVTYELDNSGRYMTLREPKPNTGSYRRGPVTNHAVTALMLSTQIAGANITAGRKAIAMNGDLTQRITGLADGLAKWLKENDK